MKQNWEATIDTPNETLAQRQMSQRFYAKRSRNPTPNDTWKLRQTKQQRETQVAGFTKQIAAVLCTYLPKYWIVL